MKTIQKLPIMHCQRLCVLLFLLLAACVAGACEARNEATQPLTPEGVQASATLTPLPPPPTPSPTFTASPIPPTATPTCTPSPVPPTPIPTLGIGSTQISRIDGMVMNYIPAGTFLMGSETGDEDEQPVHSVTLDAFWMDQTEVTVGMYWECVLAEECELPNRFNSSSRPDYFGVGIAPDASIHHIFPIFDHYPVIHVSWNQAEAYCTWAGRRLPTEAEWEYAARGGLEGANYSWGDDLDCRLANMRALPDGWAYAGYCVEDTNVVGVYPPNGYGLFDMTGNVRELVADFYSADYYSHSPAENPSGPEYGPFRVVRGASWTDDNTVSHRGLSRSYYADNVQGFRCALSP